MKKILFALLGCMASIGAYAVIASPEPIKVTQPDGSTLEVRLVGDEFHHYYTTLDGTPVRKTIIGKWIKDASVAKESTVSRNARKAAQQQMATYPLTGEPKSLVILVNFQDLKFKHSLDEFHRMLNVSGYSENGGVGSARDYFIACSDSAFAPKFDCYGPVTVSEGYAYYGANSGSNYNVHASQMVVEACNIVAASGIDMSQYDTNGDGRLDNVFIYYAGHNEAEHASENTIWPHRSAVSGNEYAGGKRIYDYACTSELRGASGNYMCGIGTFCHEFGHVLGLPDYYATDYSIAYTVGSWDIMASGSYNGNGKTPPSYSAGERFQLGWLKPIQLKDAGPYTLEPLETTNKAYLIAKTDHNLNWSSASPKEYWLLENRQAVGWDAPGTTLPGTGMLIWHINYSSSAWGSNTPNNNLPLRYDIEEAGGDKGFSAASDPFPGTKKVTQFTPTLHNGTIVEQPLLDIATNGKNIIFTFKSAGGDHLMLVPTELPVLESTFIPETKEAITPASKVKIIGEQLEPGNANVKVEGEGFQISADSTNWSTSLTMEVNNDSVLDQYLYVRYNPRKLICETQQGRISIRLNGTTLGTYTVRGISPRPVLINTPSVDSLFEVTPTSFKAKWSLVEDAEYYYVTLYHMENGTETRMESFEGFEEEAIVHEAGWYSSFYRTTTKAKADGSMSMWFKLDNENMLSPLYDLPVTKVSMWLNAPATTDVEVGWIILSGYSEEGVVVLDTIEIKKSTKQYTYTRTLEERKGFRRFEIKYAAFGGEGVCVDAFTTTFNQKTIYTYKGREHAIDARGGLSAEDAMLYAYDLLPNTDYYLRLQCSEDKGCQEQLTELSEPFLIRTKEGEPADSKYLTLAYDSISYDPGRHVIYIPQSLTDGNLFIYSQEGQLVKQITVRPNENVVPLPVNELRRGAVYSIKYVTNNKMKRKSPWIKIMFH